MLGLPNKSLMDGSSSQDAKQKLQSVVVFGAPYRTRRRNVVINIWFMFDVDRKSLKDG